MREVSQASSPLVSGFECRVLSGVYRRGLTDMLNSVSETNKSVIYRFLEEECLKKGLTELIVSNP